MAGGAPSERSERDQKQEQNISNLNREGAKKRERMCGYARNCDNAADSLPFFPPDEIKNKKRSEKNMSSDAGSKKVVAGILAILLGSLGIHKFYLGYNKEGIILLLVTLISCGALSFITSIIGLVEGILYLTKSDEEFESTYIIGRHPWF